MPTHATPTQIEDAMEPTIAKGDLSWPKIMKELDRMYVVLVRHSIVDLRKPVEDIIFDVLKHSGASEEASAALRSFLITLTPKQKDLFLFGTFMLMTEHGEEAVVKFMKTIIEYQKIVQAGGTPAEMNRQLEEVKKALDGRDASPDARTAFAELIKAASKDEVGGVARPEPDTKLLKAIFAEILATHSKTGKLEDAVLYLKAKWLDTTPAERAAYMTTTAELIPSVLKGRDMRLSKSTEEKLKELLDPKNNLLTERERLLLLTVLDKLRQIEEQYPQAFIDAFYAAAKSKKMQSKIYVEMLQALKDIWQRPSTEAERLSVPGGERLVEKVDRNLRNLQNMGIETTYLEKILILSTFHYSFLEAFQLKPPRSPDFAVELTKRVLKSFAETTSKAQEGALSARILNQEAVAYGYLAGRTKSPERKAVDDFLITPVIAGASRAGVEVFNTLAIGFVSWLSDNLDPGEFMLVERMLSKAISSGLLHDSYSMLEYAAAIGALGDKLQRGPGINLFGRVTSGEVFDIERPLYGAAEHKVKHRSDYRNSPVRQALVFRLIAATAQGGLQQPEEVLASLFRDGFDRGILRTDEDLAKFVRTMTIVAESAAGYRLGEVAKEIMNALYSPGVAIPILRLRIGEGTRTPIDTVLQNAEYLADHDLKITEGTLRNPRKAKPYTEWGPESAVPVKRKDRLAGIKPRKTGEAGA